MRNLVTGGVGFIGSHYVRTLLGSMANQQGARTRASASAGLEPIRDWQVSLRRAFPELAPVRES